MQLSSKQQPASPHINSTRGTSRFRTCQEATMRKHAVQWQARALAARTTMLAWLCFSCHVPLCMHFIQRAPMLLTAQWTPRMAQCKADVSFSLPAEEALPCRNPWAPHMGTGARPRRCLSHLRQRESRGEQGSGHLVLDVSGSGAMHETR